MNWLNINTTNSHDPRYTHSLWVDRGAWLSMVTYCTEQETGGIIVGALDQLIEYSPWKSNNILQVLLEGLKTIFRIGSK